MVGEGFTIFVINGQVWSWASNSMGIEARAARQLMPYCVSFMTSLHSP